LPAAEGLAEENPLMSVAHFDPPIAPSELAEAHRFLSGLLPPSPLLRNSRLSDEFGCELFLKMENMQPIGSFKIRGATYRISRLSPEERKKGVIAASAGNHAQGVAWGSRQLGVDALIVMPRTAPLTKVSNTRSLGAQIRLEGETYDEAFAAAQRIASETGRIYIHAFQDRDVIAGQGSVGIEIASQLPDVDCVVSSIGGGGLMAGLALALSHFRPGIRLYGAQAAGAPSMARSLQEGRAIRLASVSTFADGIAVAQASEAIREILQPRLAGCLQADDEQIAAALLDLMEKAKTVTEGAGALPLAVLEQIRDEIQGKKVVLVLGGGNIDVNVIGRVIDRGLIRAGRRLRVNVWISDRPGSLAQLTELIARQDANILQAIHDRSRPSISLSQTQVELTLETKGPEQGEQVIEALRAHVSSLELAN
jgi:threonine dehydratase